MKRARGFSLVELMIAVTLGLLLIGAASAIFVGARNGYTATTSVSAQSDSARFSTDFLARALRSSGYIGCVQAPLAVDNFQNHTVIDAFALSGTGGNIIAGYEASSTNPGQTYTLPATFAGDNTAADWTPNLPSGATYGLLGTAVGNAVQGSDVLVTYGTVNQPAVTVTSIGSTTVTVSLPSGYATLDQLFPAGTVAIISNCAVANAFQVTAVSNGTNTVTHAANSTMTMGNASATLSLTFNAGAFLYVPTTSFYYIGLGSDGDAALFKSDLTLGSGGTGTYTMVATELVPDVENMQVLYGVKSTATGSVVEYVRGDQVTATCSDGTWNCVANVSVALLVSSPTGAVPVPSSAPTYSLLGTSITAPKDTRQRTVYQITAALRNSLP
ncbi:MAG: PilW family protein [Nevskia sp.]|nr:PilW family protein [Nevskia sp.]